MATAAIDANVLVGLLDDRDTRHSAAIALRDALDRANAELVYFDCALSEAISPNPKLATAKDTQRRRWVPGTPRPKWLIGGKERNF